MEKLYESLYNDFFQDNDSNLNIFDVDTVSKISSQSDINIISKYYSTDEYNSEVNNSNSSSINIIHMNIRSLQNKLYLKNLPK